MSILIFDTYRHAKVPFEPHDSKVVRLYSCGPTVYDYAHIGNLRSFIFADTLRRWLEVSGYEVQQVMNITDVDDKTIKKSQEEGIELNAVTDRYTQAFHDDLTTLNIKPAKLYPRATDHINEMVQIIEELIAKGHAYKASDGSVYFSVASFPDYGKLSGKKIEDLRVGERVSNDEYESKDDVRDFALWKAWDEQDGDVYWETPFGKGRPGWHIECSAMSMKHLGPEFDIHTGGVDNIFPHHENEIAQSKCATGLGFAKYWMHCNYLIVEGQKMSKSLGNFYTLRDLLEKGWRAREIRYVLISTHYRSQLNFTLEGLGAARSALARLDEFRESWTNAPEGEVSKEIEEAVTRANGSFNEAMDDDLNVSAALAALFQLVREGNAQNAISRLTSGDVQILDTLWDRAQNALGVLSFEEAATGAEDGEWIEELILLRNEAREEKNWGEADRIRDELAGKGIQLKDGPDGTVWRRV